MNCSVTSKIQKVHKCFNTFTMSFTKSSKSISISKANFRALIHIYCFENRLYSIYFRMLFRDERFLLLKFLIFTNTPIIIDEYFPVQYRPDMKSGIYLVSVIGKWSYLIIKSSYLPTYYPLTFFCFLCNQ